MATFQRPTRIHGARDWLAGVAVIYGGILFIVPTALRAAQPNLFLLGNIQLPIFTWWALWLTSSLRRLLFSSTLSYLLVSIVGVLLVVASVIVTQPALPCTPAHHVARHPGLPVLERLPPRLSGCTRLRDACGHPAQPIGWHCQINSGILGNNPLPIHTSGVEHLGATVL